MWYCVITNEAPIAPMAKREAGSVAKLWARPMPITGKRAEDEQPRVGSRGPTRSHSQPTSRRATIVIATEAMTVLPICVLGQPEFLADDDHQRGDAEPREEAEKERSPGHVERPHLRRAKIGEADSYGFFRDTRGTYEGGAHLRDTLRVTSSCFLELSASLIVVHRNR